MSNDRYQGIRAALAMEPTPGPWTAKSHAAPRADNGDIGIINGKGMLVAVAYSNRCTRDNASLIAACDPDTIRELLEERDALAAKVASYEQYLKTLPANWHEDSGLATWFPITAEEIKRLRARIAELEKALREVREHVRDLECYECVVCINRALRTTS